MKKYLVMTVCLVISWNAGYSENKKFIRFDCVFFSVEKLSLLEKITKDTLVYNTTDTSFESKWEWGIFYPHRYVATYACSTYYQVSYKKAVSNLSEDWIIVQSDLAYGEKKQIKPAVLNELPLKWTYFSFFLGIYCIVAWQLRSLFIRIHSYKGLLRQQLSIGKKRNIKILAVIVAIIIIIVINLFFHSYIFLYLPFLYLILIFIPKKVWYSRSEKMEY